MSDPLLLAETLGFLGGVGGGGEGDSDGNSGGTTGGGVGTAVIGGDGARSGSVWRGPVWGSLGGDWRGSSNGVGLRAAMGERRHRLQRGGSDGD